MRKLSETLPIARRYLLTGPRQIYSGRLCAAVWDAVARSKLSVKEAEEIRNGVESRLMQHAKKMRGPDAERSTITGLYYWTVGVTVTSLHSPDFIKFRDEWLDTWQSELEAEEAKDQSTPKGTST